MIDFAQARANMVDCQVRVNDVTDPRIADAMRAIPRERFTPKSYRDVAYMEREIPLGAGRYLQEARHFAKLIQAADIDPSDLVLDVGCAAGYSTAILAQLGETVVGLESDEDLSRIASDNLAALSVDNGVVVTGPLPEGRAKQGPFNVIFVNGGLEVEPTGLIEQLADGRRL